jgi:hypothetical protein
MEWRRKGKKLSEELKNDRVKSSSCDSPRRNAGFIYDTAGSIHFVLLHPWIPYRMDSGQNESSGTGY